MNYPWKHISPRDTLLLTKSIILSDLDLRVVTSLYHSLVGHHAFSLYMTLKEYVNDLESREIVLSDILSQLEMGVKEYYEARIRLEAYGLLKVYKEIDSDHSFVLSIEGPMSANDFFNDPMLKMMLVEKLGHRMTKDLEERFVPKTVSLKEYKEITKSFVDVIHINMEKVSTSLEQPNTISRKRKENISEQVLKQTDFDWSFFLEGLNKQFVNTQSIHSDVKKLIYTFHTIYGINELDMQHFVLEASDIETGEVSGTQLTHLIQKKFLNTAKTQMSVAESEETDEKSETYRMNQLKQKGFSKEEIEIILHAEETQPYSYLKSIKQQKGGFVTSNETWLLKELVEQAPLPVSVINILINYVLIIKNSPAFEKNFALKIANDWAQNKIESPEEAMKKVKELYASTQAKQANTHKKPSNKRYYSKENNRKETLPDWATQTQSTDERISQEEENAFREKLKRIRSRKSGES